jgi:hypothetical protein
MRSKVILGIFSFVLFWLAIAISSFRDQLFDLHKGDIPGNVVVNLTWFLPMTLAAILISIYVLISYLTNLTGKYSGRQKLILLSTSLSVLVTTFVFIGIKVFQNGS